MHHIPKLAIIQPNRHVGARQPQLAPGDRSALQGVTRRWWSSEDIHRKVMELRSKAVTAITAPTMQQARPMISNGSAAGDETERERGQRRRTRSTHEKRAATFVVVVVGVAGKRREDSEIYEASQKQDYVQLYYLFSLMMNAFIPKAPSQHGTTLQNIAKMGSEMLKVPLQINGREVHSAQILDVISPASGKRCWQASIASEADTAAALRAAAAALPAWAALKPAARRDILLRTADLLENRAEDYGSFMQIETGASVGFSRMFNLPKSASMLRDIGGRIMTLENSSPVCQEDNRSALLLKVPYGVVFGIVPWNAPFILGIRAIANAIAVGNTTIIKGSELSPRSFWALGQAFADAGLPPGVLNILHCSPETARDTVSQLISHPTVRKVNYTGSVRVGTEVSALCGRFLKPCLMELGGKNSAIVLPDANLDLAAQECIKGAFLHHGQICMATDRIIIHKDVAETFMDRLRTAAIKAYPNGGPEPAMISNSAWTRVQDLVDEALRAGASRVGQPTGGNDRPGPTIVADAKRGMRIWQEEIFGLAAACMLANSEAEAVELANDTECGLSAAIFTENLRTGLRVAKQLQAGATHINSSTIHDEPVIPHGGVRSSGWGRFNATEGLLEFLQTKCITWKD